MSVEASAPTFDEMLALSGYAFWQTWRDMPPGLKENYTDAQRAILYARFAKESPARAVDTYSPRMNGDGSLVFDLTEINEMIRDSLPPVKTNSGGEPQGVGDLLAHAFWVRDAKLNTALPYVVKGVFGKGHIIVFWGAPGSGKSFVTIELCCAIGAGISWRGRRTRKGIAIYVSAESSRPYIENRLVALKSQCPAVAEAEVLIVPLTLDLLHSAHGDVDRVINTALVLAKEIGEVALVVIDTLAVTMRGGNENAPEDMGTYVANVQRVRDETGAAVLIVHHSGKDEARGMRGHSALLGALDAELAIEGAADKERILRTGKVRDGDGFADLFAFTLRTLDLGVDADGDPVRSCVVDGLGEGALGKARRRTRGLGKNQRAILRLIEAHGDLARPKLVELLGSEYGASKSAAQHSIADLIDAGQIKSLAGVISFA